MEHKQYRVKFQDDGGKVILEINVVNACGLGQPPELLQEIFLRSGVEICKINLGCFHQRILPLAIEYRAFPL